MTGDTAAIEISQLQEHRHPGERRDPVYRQTTPIQERVMLGIGIDVGTTGVRAVAIDEHREIHGQAHVAMASPRRDGAECDQDPAIWLTALIQAVDDLLPKIDRQAVSAIAIDATSGTVLLADNLGHPSTPALMYNDGRGTAEAARIAGLAPSESAAHGPFSSLAKYLWLKRHYPAAANQRVLHQADWLVATLTGKLGLSDTNNCLKMGYDPLMRCWPSWLSQLGVEIDRLPSVVEPGTALASLLPALCERWRLSSGVKIIAGTTDSTAAFLATGAHRVGEAVTSLGSTLVLKVLSNEAVFAPQFGVYSQPVGKLWLAGGGSNSGGAVLRHYFNDEALAALTPQLKPNQPTQLDYYPLLTPGERFPLCDPNLPPRLTPRPQDDGVFLQGLLEGMAHIEAEGYQRLAELGTPYPSSVITIGGGAQNSPWLQIRAKLLGVPITIAEHQDAAYGTALLTLPHLVPSP